MNEHAEVWERERPDVRSPERADGRRATLAATRFLARHKIVDPSDYPIEAIAMLAGIVVRYAPLRGVEGMLVRVGGALEIVVAEHLDLPLRRFGVMHEIGHAELHGGCSHLPVCLGERALSTYTGSPRERESDMFSRQGLMPRHIVRARFDCEAPSWQMVAELGYEFGASIVAAALRLVETSELEIALVASAHGATSWSRPSFRFQKNRGRIPRGVRLHPAAAALTVRPGEWSAPEEARASAWGLVASERAPLVEQSIATEVGELTLLWSPKGAGGASTVAADPLSLAL